MSLADQGITLPRSSQLLPAVRAATGDTTIPLPGSAPEPGPRTVQSGSQNYYEALSDSGDRTAIPLYSFAVRTMLQSWNRERLAFLGQYLYDNDGLVSYAVDTIANYSVPITAMPASPSVEANKAFEDYWHDWCKRADFTGRFHFDMIQRICCKSIDQHGDVLPIMTADHGFPQIKLAESWRVNSRYVSDKGVFHQDGVRVDKDGCVLGFYVVDPLALISGVTPPYFVPANQACLLYDPDRWSAMRGITPIRRGSNDSRDRKDIKGFEKLATKISSALAAVIKSSGTVEADVWGNDTGDPAGVRPGNQPPADATAQEKSISKAELLGGDIPILSDGQELQVLGNERPGERVIEMLDFLGACFAYGLGLPPSFIIKSKSTGPGERSENGKAQRKFDQRQMTIANFVEWVYVRVIAWGIANDGLPAVDGWYKMEWQGPPKVSIDEGRDAAQWRDDVSQGLMTEQNHFGNRALNWRRENDQTAHELDYKLLLAEQIIAKHPKAPMQSILARLGFDIPKAAPTAQGAANDGDEGSGQSENPKQSDTKE